MKPIVINATFWDKVWYYLMATVFIYACLLIPAKYPEYQAMEPGWMKVAVLFTRVLHVAFAIYSVKQLIFIYKNQKDETQNEKKDDEDFIEEDKTVLPI